jgi:pyridoxal phosphate enzyme (YggS family)
VSIRENLQRVRERIEAAAARAGRDPASVQLVAVSKTQPAEAVREAYEAGQRLFGENYAQELRDKAQLLADLPGLRFHFIGRLQRNKAKYVAPVASMMESLDDLGVGRELAKRAAAAGRVLPTLVEVNLGEEQKGGVPESELASFVEQVRALGALRLDGLMCIPPFSDDAERSRPYFARLRELAGRLGLAVLSMGMSTDYEVAIEEGATFVRVGTAIFGPRSYR